MVQQDSNVATIRENVEELLRSFRISVAEVDVVCMDNTDMLAYTHTWTMRKEQAQKYVRELQQMDFMRSVQEEPSEEATGDPLASHNLAHKCVRPPL